MSDSIGFPRDTISSVQNLIVSTSIGVADDSLQTTLDSSYTGARGVMNHGVGSEQDVSDVGSEQRALSNQAMIGLGGSSLQSHLQQKQVIIYHLYIYIYIIERSQNSFNHSFRPLKS